jgi:hypothetical protein
MLYTAAQIDALRQERQARGESIYTTCPACRFAYEPWQYRECPVCYRNREGKTLKRNGIRKPT